MTWDSGSRVIPALLGLLTIGAVTAAAPSDAWALDSERAYTSASQQISSVSSGLGAIQAAIQKSRGEERTPAQRIADAALLMGSRDYERAANVLNQVVEKYPDHPTAFPDALSMLGETYFRSKQYLSARRVFQRIVASGAEPRFAAYQAKALGRLVDICLRIKDYDALDAIFASMNSVPSGTAGSALSYARGKGLYVKKDFGGAKAALGAVDPQSEYFHQARYLLGLIAVKEATPPPEPLKEGDAPPAVPKTRYVAAIDQFQRVTQLPADTPEHRRVIDLAWLAIGRLFYEADQWAQAVQAYGHIDRLSPEFGTMLYELAWVYVRLGDVDRAQRSLEILAIAEPDSQNIADGSLLRGDLMLRAGRFEKALKVYEGVRATYDPMRVRVDAFLGSTSDPAVYYDKLSQEQLEALDTTSSLPPLAVQWAREAEDGPAAFAVIDDINQCRDLIKQSNELIEKLNAVLSSPNRVRAFPELRAGEERALALLNRVALARLALGQGMDDVEDGSLSGEIGSVRARRRALEKRLARVPVSDADFQERETQAIRQWNTQSQRLQQLTLQMDTLQATINGLRRVLREGPQAGVVRDPASVARFEHELAQNERDLALYRQQTDVLRRQISAGRVQVGFGDQRFIEDAQTRKAHRDALTREVELAAAGAGGQDLAAYAQRITPVLRAGDAADAKVEAALGEIEREVAQKSAGLRQIVGRETASVVHYSVQLEALDREARLVVGEVAMRNFGLVRDRLKNIILRADVGITEEAWEVREEQMTRVRSLQVERAREDRVLKEELNEVLDDSGDPEDEK
ncbi:tetratricopeptide repeat protein [Sorangium sp. So ce136]|uniref:tetratricopeptide repeat protein n=1 Tax=Sorangium sp. So ce136 TaxID=3133284 RepID=UPI003F08A788